MLSVSTQIRLNRPVNLRTDFLREEAKQICSDESRYRGYNGGDGVRVIGQEFRQKKLRVKGFEDLKLGGGDKSVAEHSHGVMTTAGLLVVVSSASISTACRQQCAMVDALFSGLSISHLKQWSEPLFVDLL
ncbi:unnamed protein product [Arabidopsis thaliana]|uniref:Uncharacterized protein n=1 Tax=Arabidopsis thaliana TaxID=3702 RepID=A0A5S9Y837_ARATH|nr:unnamed protein product [Arabidopsis thaliana]